MKLPIVEITWVDASFQSDTVCREELRQLVVLRSVGYLLSKDSKCVTIAMEVCDEDENFRHVTHIPACCIKRIRRL